MVINTTAVQNAGGRYPFPPNDPRNGNGSMNSGAGGKPSGDGPTWNPISNLLVSGFGNCNSNLATTDVDEDEEKTKEPNDRACLVWGKMTPGAGKNLDKAEMVKSVLAKTSKQAQLLMSHKYFRDALPCEYSQVKVV